MGFQEATQKKWEVMKPILQGFIGGLVVGPIVVLWLGWAVTSGSVQGKVDTALVNLQASICAARARAEVKDAAKLDFQARNKLAQKWATMPGQEPGSATYEVTNTCTEMLAETAS